MNTVTFRYTITLVGNDLDAKTAQALSAGDSLVLSRVEDEYDTYEIVVSTSDGKALDMLGYEESVGIAPFIDSGVAKILSAQVEKVTTTQGKSRATDETCVELAVEFRYDEQQLTVFRGGYDDVPAFMPTEDALYSLCLYRLLDYGMDIITQTHLNRYLFEVDMDDDTKQFFDIDWQDEAYMFQGEVLFNESFTKCKVRSKIYSDSENIPLETDALDAETLLTFVNHLRIFNDEKALTDCEVEL